MKTGTQIIREELARTRVISFARFMELALYHPETGYYRREVRPVGRAGDFFTSVSVGPLFGELLCFQFREWLRDAPFETVQLVEAGAHDGRLALDILEAFQQHDQALLARTHYWILEPSAPLRAAQAQTLRKYSNRVRWMNDWSVVAAERVRGVIFSNELLDAMPVHRFAWNAVAGRWFEWGVGWGGERFEWVRLPEERASEEQPRVPDELLAILPDGFVVERSPAAEFWWRQAAGLLEWGRLVAIDYGLQEEQFIEPQRGEGTARAYRRHHEVPDLLADPGEQDLTAHVNFTRIRRAGEEAGLRTEAFASQESFLVAIAERLWKHETPLSEWSSGKRRQFQTLVHPQHLGRPFKVLVQTGGRL